MSMLRKKILKFVTIACIWILAHIVILKLTSNGRNFYNDPELRNFERVTNTEDDSSGFFQTKLGKSLLIAELLIDANISEPHGNEWLDAVQKELPNVPFDYWIRHNEQWNESTGCNKYPLVFKLHFHNIYWQTYQRKNITFQLYSAYYDNRAGVPNGPVVRLLAMVNEKERQNIPANFCQLWYDNTENPIVVPILEYHRIYPYYWDLLDGYMYPYLITCTPQSTADRRIPRTISLIKSKCETAGNNLRIWFEEPELDEPKNRFAVCVKGLSFPYTDNSARLVEWLELLRILGASKIFIYTLAVHPNVTKILAYYEKTGFVHMQDFTLAAGEPSLPYYQHHLLAIDQMNKRLNEFIPYNDCLYRYMYKYDYIAALDIDEIIMPLEPYRNWQQLIEKAFEVQQIKYPKCEFGFASVCFLNTYFPEINTNSSSQDKDIPHFLYMLQHTFRVPEHSTPNAATKCFHNTSNAHTLHNHFTLTWLRSCRPMELNKNVAQLQHYRQTDFENLSKNPAASKQSDLLVQDKSIWRFKNELIMRSLYVLRNTGFLKPTAHRIPRTAT